MSDEPCMTCGGTRRAPFASKECPSCVMDKLVRETESLGLADLPPAAPASPTEPVGEAP